MGDGEVLSRSTICRPYCKASNITDAISILLLSTPLLLDTGICVLRRLKQGAINKSP